MLSQSIPQVINSAMMILVTFVSMLATNLLLTGVVILCIIVMLLVTKFLAGRSGRYFVQQQVKLGDLNGYIEEMINGQKVVKVFCHEEEAQEGFDKVNDALCESADKANKYANILMPILINIGNVQYVIVAMAGGALALGGIDAGITLGTIATFLQLSKSFSNPISQISQQFNSVVMALAGAQRIFNLMDEPSEEDHGTVTLVNVSYDKDGQTLVETREHTNLWAWKVPQADGSFQYVKLAGDVRFDHVDFAYEEGKTILHDISLFAKPGQKLAFVGATGAGKTTITNLINRFYDIADGKIHYDGISINDIKKPDLRRSLGIVLQDTNLFTGTVRENIRYGNLDATDEEVEAAAVAAAHRHRPGRRGRPAGDDPGRGHLLHRHPHRGHCPAGHGRPDERPHRVRHRPPPVHRAQLRRHHGAGSRPHRGAGRPRGSDPAARHLLSALYRRF